MNSSEDPKLPVIVITYNRPASLTRLLESLTRSDAISEAKILVSIEGGAPEEVYQIALKYKEILGLEILRYPERKGLKEHVLRCGDMLASMGGGVLLEDDLVVAPSFCSFAKNAAAFYRDQKDIASISLYSHKRNVYTNGVFEADDDEYDTFFLQLPSSWGQYWYPEKWGAFRAWLRKNDVIDPNDPILPLKLRRWPDSSWLKHFTHFCVRERMQNVYPRVSYTTNFSEAGTHMQRRSAIFQVSLAKRLHANFVPSIDASVAYDCFFEREPAFFIPFFSVDPKDLIVDLYGQKESDGAKRLWLTRKLTGKPVKRFGNSMRPLEENIARGCLGDFFSLAEAKNVPLQATNNASQDIIDVFGEIPGRSALNLLWDSASRKIQQMIGR